MSNVTDVTGLAQPKIAVVGSSNIDMVVKADHLPSPGETVLGGQFVMVSGGKGANQAVAAARLGAQVTFVTRVGSDLFGDEAVANFRKEGIDTQFIARDADEQSGIALIFVDEEGENEIVVAPGANRRLTPDDVDKASDALSACSVLLLQMEIPLETAEHAARLARQKGVVVILDPAPMPPRGVPANLLSLVDILVPNESEARVLLGFDSSRRIDSEAASGLLDVGVSRAILTLGAKGAFVVTSIGVERIPCPCVRAVDATAAGDAFAGALAVALGSGMDLVPASVLAAKAGALSVTRLGAQSSLPTREEVLHFAPAEWT